MSDTTISERIKTVRKMLKLNQTVFSEKLSITQTSVSQIEREKNGISYDVFKALVNKLGVNPYWLMNGTGSIFSSISGYDEGELSSDRGALSNLQGSTQIPVIDERRTSILAEESPNLDALPKIVVPWNDSRSEGALAIQYPKSNMMPNIYPNDWLVCSKIDLDSLIAGKLYLFIINSEMVLGTVNSIKKTELLIKFETGVINAQRVERQHINAVYQVKMRISNMLNNVHDFMRDEINQIKDELKRLESIKAK